MNQKLSPGQHQKTRKLGWGVTFLLILSAFINFAFFAIAFGSFLAVGLNLEGPFRLGIFWFPMPRWFIWVILIAVISNVVFWVVAYLFFTIIRFRQSKKNLQGQERPPVLGFPSRWKMIWYGGGLFLAAISGPLFSASNLSVPQGKTELVSIAMVSPTEGWAVGNFEGEQPEGVACGVIWHYHDGKWAQVAQLADDYLNGVTAFPDGEAWAVGSDNTILHEQGGNWTQVHHDALDFPSVFTKVAMVSSTEGWAVGYSIAHDQPEGMIWHWSQGKWVQLPPITKKFLWHVSALADGEAWAVGSGGTVLHEREGSWSQMTSLSQYGVNDISMLSPTEGWATGDQLLHFQNGTWTPFSQAIPFLSPFKVVMNSSNEGWGMINDQILHYTQGTWQQVDTSSISPYLHNIYDITLAPGSSSEGWMVGAGAISDTNTIPTPTILHMKNGIWSIFPL